MLLGVNMMKLHSKHFRKHLDIDARPISFKSDHEKSFQGFEKVSVSSISAGHPKQSYSWL
jgi:hypothetical protein